MGFGLLFIGSFFAFIGLISIVRVVGFAVVIAASKKLKQYNSSFALLGIAGAVMMIISLASFGTDLVSWTIGERYIGDEILSVLGHVESIASSLFALVLLWAIKNIAVDTEAYAEEHKNDLRYVEYNKQFDEREKALQEQEAKKGKKKKLKPPKMLGE